MTVVSMNKRLGALEAAGGPFGHLRHMSDEALRARFHQLVALLTGETLLPDGFATMLAHEQQAVMQRARQELEQ